MRICFITDRYPTNEYPVNTFLDQLVCHMADQEVGCTVIAPYMPIVDKLHKRNYNAPYHRQRVTSSGKVIDIYSPTYFSVTNRKVCGLNFANSFLKKFIRTVNSVIEKEKIEFDAIYGHFILPSGFAAAEIGRKHKKPSFFAYGESSFDIVGRSFSTEQIRCRLEYVSGVIAVSSKNRDELIEHGAIESGKIGVFPNAIDSNTFCVMNKKDVRQSLGLKEEDFVVVFVGHFINRKGSQRLSEALTRFSDVKSIFIGAGSEEPFCDNIIYKGRVPHNQIPIYLNAADVFVLPTLAEGCCNAIVEAMACGLPVISSDLPFNNDILNEKNSIRIDPQSIDQIVFAIQELKCNKSKREELAKAALLTAKELTIDKRAKNIRKFIEESMSSCLP